MVLQAEYMQLVKEAFMEKDAMAVIVGLVAEPLSRHPRMTEADGLIVQLVITFIRNLLTVPDRAATAGHSTLLWVNAASVLQPSDVDDAHIYSRGTDSTEHILNSMTQKSQAMSAGYWDQQRVWQKLQAMSELICLGDAGSGGDHRTQLRQELLTRMFDDNVLELLLVIAQHAHAVSNQLNVQLYLDIINQHKR